MIPDDWLWYGIWIDTCDISHFRTCKWRICITYKRSQIWESQLVRRPSIWRDCRAKAVTTCNHPCSNTNQPCTLHSELHTAQTPIKYYTAQQSTVLHSKQAKQRNNMFTPSVLSFCLEVDVMIKTLRQRIVIVHARCHKNIQKGSF